ncbi:MAG: hypothetical protein ACOX7R_11735 [Acetivibrionales bacterium]|jgi:hypothetical protein
MALNHKSRNNKDIEDSSETIISSSSYLYSFINGLKSGSKQSITGQQVDDQNFEGHIEKRR